MSIFQYFFHSRSIFFKCCLKHAFGFFCQSVHISQRSFFLEHFIKFVHKFLIRNINFSLIIAQEAIHYHCWQNFFSGCQIHSCSCVFLYLSRNSFTWYHNCEIISYFCYIIFYIVENFIIRSWTCPVAVKIIVCQRSHYWSWIVHSLSIFSIVSVIPCFQSLSGHIRCFPFISAYLQILSVKHICLWFSKSKILTELLFRSHCIFNEHI